jgi:hypothetical protein
VRTPNALPLNSPNFGASGEKVNLEKVLTDRNLLMRAPFFETGIEHRKRLLNKVKKTLVSPAKYRALAGYLAANPTVSQSFLQHETPFLCRFSDGGMTAYPHAEAAGDASSFFPWRQLRNKVRPIPLDDPASARGFLPTPHAWTLTAGRHDRLHRHPGAPSTRDGLVTFLSAD